MSKYWITPQGNYIIGYGADIAPQDATEVAGPPEGHEGSWPPEETDIWVNGAWTRDAVVVAANVRAERNALIKATDFYALSDVVMTTEMTNYRQALRAVPEQSGFPHTIVWPTEV